MAEMLSAEVVTGPGANDYTDEDGTHVRLYAVKRDDGAVAEVFAVDKTDAMMIADDKTDEFEWVSIPELAEGDEVTLALDATVYVHVTRDGVVKVVVLPDVADAGALAAEVWVHDSTNSVTDEGVTAAKTWAESNPWAPLAELPADVVWEG
jgi:hypothetical protein